MPTDLASFRFESLFEKRCSVGHTVLLFHNYLETYFTLQNCRNFQVTDRSVYIVDILNDDIVSFSNEFFCFNTFNAWTNYRNIHKEEV